jgi:sodium pump decarboxylase gamma subunit
LFGETIDLLESLQITVLGMAVVFSVLVLLMAIIKVMEKTMYKDPAKNAQPAKNFSTAEVVEAEPPKDEDNMGQDLELVAVIAAAAAANMGVRPSNIIIRNIVRMPETAPIWNLSGRADLMASRSKY